MISQHASWMVVVVASVLTPALTLLLMAPALLWAAFRRGQGVAVERLAWTWDLTGAILVSLLLLGPLQTIQGLHPIAYAAVALGAGTRFRRWLVRPTLAWQRGACWAGGIVVGVLPVYSLWQYHAAVTAPLRVWSTPGTQAPSVLWIVLDTLRADHTSVAGYSRPTTPALEEWSKLGITFDMARSPAGWTLPSHLTMFTGLWPSQHGARVDRPYFGTAPTLAEHLRARGYATAGIVANVRMCNRAYGVGRGFDTFVDYPWNNEVSCEAGLFNSAVGSSLLEIGRRLLLPVPRAYPFNFRYSSRVIADRASYWLDDVSRRNESTAPGSKRPFFLFLNFFDVHGPYLPSARAKRLFFTCPLPPERLASPGCGWDALQAAAAAAAAEKASRRQELEEVRRRLEDLYDECIHETDAELGQFLAGLRQSGQLANTWVVITSDHGEHFGEHNQFGHGSSLYNEVTHVPLILIPPLGPEGPGQDPTPALRGLRIGVPVSTRDLARTLAELTGSGVANPFPGGSLACHWTSDRPAVADPVFSQLVEPKLGGEDFRTENLTSIESVIEGDHVLIDSDRQFFELYNLFRDPKQELNLANERAEQQRVLRMMRTLDALRSEVNSRDCVAPISRTSTRCSVGWAWAPISC